MSTSIVEILSTAEVGPVFTFDLVPLSRQGKVRVTYNWLYSALNCDPNDTSSFPWILERTATGSAAFSPREPYEGMKLYASVRPDNSYYVQMQAPGSADWITAAAADEEMTLIERGLLVVEIQGVDKQWVTVAGTPTSHDTHSGYQVQGAPSPGGLSGKFLIAVGESLQPSIPMTPFNSLAPDEVSAELAQCGVPEPDSFAREIFETAQPD